MRLWVALTFAVIGAVTALAVTSIFAARSEHALQGSAEDFAVGNTLSAADSIAGSIAQGTKARSAANALANRRRFAIWVFNERGKLISGRHSRRAQFDLVPGRNQAVHAAIAGSRYLSSLNKGRATVVAVPVPRVGGAVVTYSTRPELAAQLGIVHSQVVQTALFASLTGALAGLLVAMLIAARLRRIGAAASAIEAGNFETTLHPWLKDELGSLAETIDRMRGRLRESFARVEAERDRLQRLLGRLHDGVIAVDPRLRVEFSNEAARRLLRVHRFEEGDLLPDAWGTDLLRRFAESLFEPGAKVVQETFSPTDYRSYAVVGIPPRGPFETAVLVLTDVSVRERRERAEREFVTNAAHELRTPLATITGSIQVLQAGAKDVPEQRDRFLEHIEREAARLSRLTRALLVLARAQTRAEAPKLADVELEPLLEAIAAGTSPPEGVRVEVECPPGLLVVAEPDLVEQAVSNLAANAVENTTEGKIVISARPLGDGGVALEVSDTGTGIPLERQDRIFDRFYRAEGRSPGNFGLGLAIVREVVTALGGRIDLESTPGSGTTVRITLPQAHTVAA